MYQTNFSNYNKYFGGSLLRKLAKTGRWLTVICFILVVGCATQDIPDFSVQLAPELNGRVQIAMGEQKVVLNFKVSVKKDRANLDVWGAMGINRQSFLLVSKPPILKQKIGKNWTDLSTEELANTPISELPLKAFPYWIMGVPRASSPYTVLQKGIYRNSFKQDNWEIEVIRSNRHEDEGRSRSKLYPTERIMTSGVLSVRWFIKTSEKSGSRFDRGLLHQENNDRS